MLISIIIPIYNAEKYLRQCLNSIMAQAFTSWECLLIDDGSTDQSGSICDEYANREPRFSVFHQKNGGVSSARNLGLRESKGDWITFVDADDELAPDALNIYTSHISDKVSCILASWYFITSKDTKICNLLSTKSTLNTDNENALLTLFGRYLDHQSKYGFQSFIWYGLFRNEILNEYQISFNRDIAINEDGLFLIDYLCHCKGNIIITNEPTYRYYERIDSTMNIYDNHLINDKFLSSVYARIMIYDLIAEHCLDKRLINFAKRYVIYYLVRTNQFYANGASPELMAQREPLFQRAKKSLGMQLRFEYMRIYIDVYLIRKAEFIIKRLLHK